MKKLMVSCVAAAVALTTTASALEDIKVSGQAKVWYETSSTKQMTGKGPINAANEAAGKKLDDSLFSADTSSAEVVFKLGMTGKQGDVGFGTTVYQTSTMGLEGKLVNNTRTNTNGVTGGTGQMFVGEAYITAPIAPSTLLKFGKQELDTPLAFTERWNAVPNTFNAAVAINSSIDNLTLIGAYVGQDSATNFKSDGEVLNQYFGGAYTLAALYNAGGLSANFWAYHLENVGSSGLAWSVGGPSGLAVEAAWLDVGMKVADMADVKAYAAYMTHDGDNAEDTTAFALSAGADLSGIKLFAAGSMVNEDGDIPVSNTSTGGKKTKLPTAGVYTDGLYVAMPGSTAFKLKAATKLGSTGLALQGVMNSNSNDGADAQDTSEIDLIVTQKLGAFNLKGIVMQRMFDDSDTDDKVGGTYVRAVISANF